MFIFKDKTNEVDDAYIERCWFIVKNMHKYPDNYAYLKNLSLIWASHKYLNVTYDQHIMEELGSCENP